MSVLTFVVRLFLFLGLMSVCLHTNDANAQKRNRRNNAEAAIKPSESPEVKEKQVAYDDSKSYARHAKQVVTECRKSLGNAMRGARPVEEVLDKPQELVDGEKELAELRQALKDLSNKLIQQIDPKTRGEYLVKMAECKEELQRELADTKPGENNPRLKELTRKHDTIRNQLFEYEKYVVEGDPTYKALQAKVYDLNQTVVLMRRRYAEAGEKANAVVTGEEKAQLVRQAKEALDKATSDYKKAMLAEIKAKKDLEQAIRVAVATYKRVLAEQAEAKRQEQIKKAGRRRSFF